MGLLLLEIVAASGVSLYELVEDLLAQVGPAFYERRDMRLIRPSGTEPVLLGYGQEVTFIVS